MHYHLTASCLLGCDAHRISRLIADWTLTWPPNRMLLDVRASQKNRHLFFVEIDADGCRLVNLYTYLYMYQLLKYVMQKSMIVLLQSDYRYQFSLLWESNCCLMSDQQFSAISWQELVTFDEMIVMSTLYYTNTLSLIFIVLAHWNNNLWTDMLLHSDTLSWFWANQSLLLILILHA